MKHVAPHRFADAWAGKLPAAERAAIDRHVAECAQCAKVRDRVTRASDSFASIKSRQTPELGWDSVRAKVHWSVSTERRAKVPAPRSRGWWAAGAVAVAGVVAIVVVPPREQASPTVAPIDPPKTFVPAAKPALALSGLVNRTTGDVMIDGIRPVDPFALKLHAGVTLATGDGRVDVQFGDASAFRLGPHSRLELVKFDSHAIELAIDGTLDVTVAPRTSGQTFIVRAGDRTIEVRGTQFRVDHTGEHTTIACRHGLVAVSDAAGKVDVAAARRVQLGTKPGPVVTMSADELTELAEATPLTMPVWDLGTLASSAPLVIATAGRRSVRLDGVEVGEAPMRVRVMPGRHTVEAADNHGRYRRAGWIDVAAPTANGKPARLDIQPEPPPTRSVDERRRQLRSNLDRAKLSACTRAAAKQGLAAGAYVQIEISVDAQGAVGYLNVTETDLPKKLADCVHGVLREIRFKPGQAASWKERIDL